MENQVLVPCEISKGMFDTERAVEITLPNGDKISLFADKDLIQVIDGKAYLRVNVTIGENEKGQRQVLLPSESFEKGTRWLSLPSDHLVPA
jgi:hypothetical protein